MKTNKQRKPGIKVSYAFALSAMAFLLAGCLSQIEVNTEQRGGQVVISGQVSTQPDRNRVDVGITSNEDRLPFPISGAEVLVRDQDGNVAVYQEDPERPGTYVADGFSGVPGYTYHIEVTFENGQRYYSIPETIPEAAGSLEVYHEVVNEDFVDLDGIVSNLPFLKIYVNSNIPSQEEPPYVKWLAEEVYLIVPTDFPDPFGNIPPNCFVTQNADPQRVEIFDGVALNTRRVENRLVASRLIDRSFHYRHYFTVYQASITAEAHEYWRKVDIVANQVGSIFDTPPAAVTGNIVHENSGQGQLGYFQAVNETFERFFLLPSDLPFELAYRNCLYDPATPFNAYPSECLNCISARNSSYNRPPWF